jgi:predicted GIY-YIG superfamily endonuclease
MNGYIYGVYCKNETITDFYIGSTNNYKKRYNEHQKYLATLN